jgi:Flp pilus assembly pilin Flp
VTATGARTWFENNGGEMKDYLRNLWLDEEGQDIAEYAVMLAVILVIVVGTIRLISLPAGRLLPRSVWSDT